MTLYQVRMYTSDEKRLKKKHRPGVRTVRIEEARIEGRRLRAERMKNDPEYAKWVENRVREVKLFKEGKLPQEATP